MSHDMKSAWVDGYASGIFTGLGLVDDKSLSPAMHRHIEKIRSRYLSNFSYGEIVAMMDKLFEDPANVAISMSGMYSVAVEKLQGSSQASIDSYLEELRELYSQRQ